MRLLNEYLEFLRDDLGQCEGTLSLRERYVKQFLKSIGWVARPSKLKVLRANKIHDYVTKTILPLSRSSRKHTVNSLRSFLRFAYCRGYLPKNIVNAVPVVRTPARLAEIPRGHSWETVKKLLSAPDRRTETGRRDYAMLQLLASYGVRSGQVTRLQLRDINWHAGTISFQSSKGGKALCFPLNKAVTVALLAYLRDRKKRAFSEVFLSVGRKKHWPIHGQVWRIVSGYCDRIGVKSSKRGPHAIRHAFAARLVEKRTPMKTISDLMGHRSIATTFIYTKVDVGALRLLAREWPEVRS